MCICKAVFLPIVPSRCQPTSPKTTLYRLLDYSLTISQIHCASSEAAAPAGIVPVPLRPLPSPGRTASGLPDQAWDVAILSAPETLPVTPVSPDLFRTQSVWLRLICLTPSTSPCQATPALHQQDLPQPHLALSYAAATPARRASKAPPADRKAIFSRIPPRPWFSPTYNS